MATLKWILCLTFIVVVVMLPEVVVTVSEYSISKRYTSLGAALFILSLNLFAEVKTRLKSVVDKGEST